MDEDLKKLFDSFNKDYNFKYSVEDISYLLGKDILVCSTLGAIQELMIKYLAQLTGKDEKIIREEYTKLYTDTFISLYAEYVSKRAITG